MKRILAILLIVMMVFGMTACKSKDSSDEDAAGGDAATDLIVSEDEEGGDDGGDSEYTVDEYGYIVESGEYEEDVVESTDDIDKSSYSADDYEAYFDFGFSVTPSFGMSGAIAQLDYSDLEGLMDTIEDNLSAALASTVGGEYSIFSDYDEDDEDEIDKLVYTMGLENDDEEARYVECGAYHTTAEKYYQYVILYSENFYSRSEANIDTIMDIAKNAYGITLSRSRMTEAINIAWDMAEETDDWYTLYQIKTLTGSGYTETVRVNVEAFPNDDGQMGYYVAFERERCYN